MNDKLQSVDFTHLNTLVGGDINFRNELIGIFLEQIPDFIMNMKQFLAGNKLNNLAREAHTAKSSVLIFGMTNTGYLLKEIQHWAESKKIMEIENALTQVELDLNYAKTELTKVLKES